MTEYRFGMNKIRLDKKPFGKKMEVYYETQKDGQCKYDLTMFTINKKEKKTLGHISYKMENHKAVFDSFSVSDVGNDDNSLMKKIGIELVKYFIKSAKKDRCSKIEGEIYGTDYVIERLNILESCGFERSCKGNLTGFNEYKFNLDV